MVGIVTYGAYVPEYRIRVEEIARVWGSDPEDVKSSLGLLEKSVPDMDEDAATMAVEASRNALKRVEMDVSEIGAIYVGSESHPYAVKPTATIVAEAISASNGIMAADFEFACKAGTAAIQACMGLVSSGHIKYGLAIGSDVSQASQGDALEYATGAAAAAFVIGDDPIVEIEATYSFTTDTPDFWRRDLQATPVHGGRFTGEPAYFKHIISATKGIFDRLGTKSEDYDFFVMHQPNGKFPIRVAKLLGFKKSQIEHGLIVKKIGNAYSASSLIGLCAILDKARPGEKILMTSFGSGAGADSFSMEVRDKINENRDRVPTVEVLLSNPKYIDYAEYSKRLK
jgi:hydroxymethylglutaryl-CoA synthase